MKKLTAQQTLHFVLHSGLRLLSPFMPFITEELFQRLPKVANEVPSICVAPYPEVEGVRIDSTLSPSIQFCKVSAHSILYFLLQYPWRNTVIEGEVEFVQKIVHLIRSARSDYSLLNKTKTEGQSIIFLFFCFCRDE